MTQEERIKKQKEQLTDFRDSVKRYAKVSGKVPQELIEQLDEKYRHYMTYYVSKERKPEETAAMGILGAEMFNSFAQIFNPNGSADLNAAATNYRKNLVNEAATAGTDKIQDLEEKLAFSECFDLYAEAVSNNYGKKIFDYEEENDPKVVAWSKKVWELNEYYDREKQRLEDNKSRLFKSVIHSNVGELFERSGDKEKNYDIIINEHFSEAKKLWKRVKDFYNNKKDLPKDYDIKAAREDIINIRHIIFEFFANELQDEVGANGFDITDEENFNEQLEQTKKDLIRIVDEAVKNGQKLRDELANKVMAGENENIDELKKKQIESGAEYNRVNGYLTYFNDKSKIIENLSQFAQDSADLVYYWSGEKKVKEPVLPEKPKFEAANPADQYELLTLDNISRFNEDDEELMMDEAIEDVLSEKDGEYGFVRSKISRLQALKEEEEEQKQKEEEERINSEQEEVEKAEEDMKNLKLDDIIPDNIPDNIPENNEGIPENNEGISENKEEPKKEDKKEEIPENKENKNEVIPEKKEEILQNKDEILEIKENIPEKNEEIIKVNKKSEPAEMKEVPKNDEFSFEEPHDYLPENDYSDLYHVMKEQSEVGKRNKMVREYEINHMKDFKFEGKKADADNDIHFCNEYCKELQRYANYLDKTVWFYQSNSESFHKLQAALKPFKDMKFDGFDMTVPYFPDELAKKFDAVMAASAEYTSSHAKLDTFSSSQKERLKTCRRLDMLHDLFEKRISIRFSAGYMKAQMAEKLAFNEAFNDLDSKDPKKKAVAKQVLTKYDALKIKCNENKDYVNEFVTALGPEHSKYNDLQKLVAIKGSKFSDKMKAFMKAKENAKQTEKNEVVINQMIK